MQFRFFSSCFHMIVALFISLSSFNLYASDELPLWELGLGGGALHQSYYTGTNQTQSYVFPVILPVYRGDFFKSDDKGIRAQLFNDKRYKLDFSIDFSFAVESDDIDLRQGMPDIGYLLEVGPSLEVYLSNDKANNWYVKVPVRVATEIDGSEWQSAGYNFSPALVYEKVFPNNDWKFGSSIAVQYGDSQYNSIYYSVAPEFATSTRSAYEAEAGYAGTRLQLSMRYKDRKNLWVGFIRYDNISGAVFDDSPLVETKDNLTVGFLYSRYLLKSKKTVIRD